MLKGALLSIALGCAPYLCLADSVFNASRSCTLKKFVKGRWVKAEATEIRGIAFKKIRVFAPPSHSSAVGYHGVAYSAPSKCFSTIEEKPAAPDAIPASTPK